MDRFLPILTLAFLLLLTSTVSGQKLDREKLGYYNYQQPAASTELFDDRYFLLMVELDQNDAYRRKIFEQKFDGGDYLKVDANQDHDFTIEVLEGTFSYNTPTKKSYEHKENRTMYYYEGNVRYHYTIKVYDIADQEIFRDDVTGSEKMRADASGSLSVANDYYVKKKEQFKEEIMLKVIEPLQDKFHDQFSDVQKTIHLNAIKIKEKKFTYPECNKAFDNLQRVYDIMSVSGETTSESEEKLNEAIDILLEFVTDATPEDEKSKKNADVTAAAYYDLGIAYFLNREYDEANTAFEKAASYNEKVLYDVKNMVKVTDALALRSQNP